MSNGFNPNNQNNPGAAIPVYVVGNAPGGNASLGYEQISGAAAAVNLTPPDGAKTANILVEGQPVRWRDDGVDPTKDVGMPIAVGVPFSYSGDLEAIKFIGTNTSVLNVTYA